MINNIHIINFQSHKDTYIEFVGGVNALTGVSDSGKSAIIRAIIWVLFNQPSGSGFMSDFAAGEPTSVSIDLHGNIIKRLKSPSRNEYYLNGEVYKAFGQSVPDDIAAVVNMNETNIQTQFASHFMLSESSGTISKQFNKIANLELIDQLFSAINSESRQLAVERNIVAQDRDSTQDNLKELQDLNVAEEALQRAETAYLDVQHKQQAMCSLKSQIEIIDTLKPQECNVVPLEMRLSIVEKSIAHYDSLVSEVQRLNLAYESVGPEIATINIELGTIEKLQKQVGPLTRELDTLKRQLALVKQASTTLDRYKKELVEVTAQYNELFPEVCPLCETPKN